MSENAQANGFQCGRDGVISRQFEWYNEIYNLRA